MPLTLLGVEHPSTTFHLPAREGAPLRDVATATNTVELISKALSFMCCRDYIFVTSFWLAGRSIILLFFLVFLAGFFELKKWCLYLLVIWASVASYEARGWWLVSSVLVLMD